MYILKYVNPKYVYLVLTFLYFSFCESIFLLWFLRGAEGEFSFSTIACRWHLILSTMKSSTSLRGCFLWGSVFPVKAMASLCFCLKRTSPWTWRYFSSSFHHAYMLQQLILSFDKVYLFITFCSKFIVCRSSCTHNPFA